MPEGSLQIPEGRYVGHPTMIQAAQKRMRRMMMRSLAVPNRMPLPDWADKYRKLSGKSSARPGDWKTAKVEIARGPMLSVSEPGVQTISLMVATQLLKTSFLENVIGYFAHIDPSPMLVVYPNEAAAEAFSKERLAPLVASTPVLKERVGDPRSRKSENTIEVKHFPGGFVAMVSAGSPMNLAARPIRVVLLDEIDKYQPTKEGDPIALAEERTSTFPNRLSVRACSPTTEETSRIYHSYLSSDQRRPYVACPHCGCWQYLDFFKHVHWEKRGGQHDPETACVFCEDCNLPWTEEERRQAIRTIQWRQTKTFYCCGEGQDPRHNRRWQWDEDFHIGYALCVKCGRMAVPNRHAGFTASKLYSPFLKIPELAAKWLEAEKDIESRQTFYNTQLALPYKVEATKEVAAKTLAARREAWGELVPNNVCVLTAGVDVQTGDSGALGRLECEVVGWDPREESWSLNYEIFSGDPAKPEVWNELDAYLSQIFVREDGRKMRILGTCIDSGGHHTEEVYKFCLARVGRNIWATKGASDRSGQWSPVWPARDFRAQKRRRRLGPHRYRPVIIGVNAAKEAIRQRLLITEPGPGYCHFPVGRPSGYFDQITAERLIVERKGGMVIRKWQISAHQANEALDARVLAYAALQGLINDRGFKPLRVEAILAHHPDEDDEDGTEKAILDSGQPPPLPPSQESSPQPARRPVQAPAAVPQKANPMQVTAPRRVVRSSFMSQRMF